MSNITLETSSFSEQLGVYDFFNVLFSGAVFSFSTLGIGYLLFPCLVSRILSNFNVFDGVVLAVFAFFIGLIIHELGSIADRDIWHVKEYSYRNFLKETCTEKYILRRNHTWKYVDKVAYKQAQKSKKGNYVIHNPVLLNHYRKIAQDVLLEHVEMKGGIDISGALEDDNVNRCIFSYCEYYVAHNGKDKKVEKLRALFAMARSFATCSLLILMLSAFALAYTYFPSVVICCRTRDYVQIVLWLSCFFTPLIYFLFRYRMTKMMRHMILIMMGHYNACIVGKDNKKPANPSENQASEN